MDKTDALSRLTFCGECDYWKPINDKKLKEEWRGYVGIYNKPLESIVERCRDEFCSRGTKK